MEEPQTAFALIKQLQEREDSPKPSFTTLFDYLDAKAREKGIPLKGQLELTPLCNFDCKMCYTHLTKEQLRGRSLLTVDQWKDLIHQAWEAGLMSVNLSGGECLTYPGFEEIYLYLHSLGCEVLVLSNGLLLDERWVRFFQAHKPILIQITLYGGDEETYERVTGHRGFETVSKNIRRAIEAGLPVSVNITPSAYMGEGVLKALKAAKDFGVEYTINDVLIDPKEETGRAGQARDLSVEEYARIYAYRNELNGVPTTPIPLEKLPPAGGPCRECEERGLPCAAGMSCFTIEWDGTMLMCNSIRQYSGKPLEEGFQAVWDRLHRVAADWPQIAACNGCPYVHICTNCMAVKNQFAEPGKQPWALCEQVRYLVSRGVKKIPVCE